jgi:2-iminobutanoate/2-iminopropanoate deaminase
MARNIVTTSSAPQNPNYSQAVKAGGLIFVSGQAGIDPATGNLVEGTIREQTRQALTNVSAILDAAGSSIEKVVSATFILADPADFSGMNQEWQTWFPSDPPARQGAKFPLAIPGMRISVAAIAEL